MSWKIFITAFISTACISFPQNIIGCGPSPDPYDYYTSFFSKEVSDAKGYKPFYYSSLLEFYDDWDYDTQRGYEEDKIIQEWKQYCNVSTSDAVEFIYNTTAKDVKQLVEHLAKNTALSLPDSIRKNGMTKCLLEKKMGLLCLIWSLQNQLKNFLLHLIGKTLQIKTVLLLINLLPKQIRSIKKRLMLF